MRKRDKRSLSKEKTGPQNKDSPEQYSARSSCYNSLESGRKLIDDADQSAQQVKKVVFKNSKNSDVPLIDRGADMISQQNDVYVEDPQESVNYRNQTITDRETKTYEKTKWVIQKSSTSKQPILAANKNLEQLFKANNLEQRNNLYNQFISKQTRLGEQVIKKDLLLCDKYWPLELAEYPKMILNESQQAQRFQFSQINEDKKNQIKTYIENDQYHCYENQKHYKREMGNKNQKILSIEKKTNLEKLKVYVDKYPLLELRKAFLQFCYQLNFVAHAIIASKPFDNLSIAVILFNSIVMMIQDPEDTNPSYIFGLLDNIFLCLYSSEMVLKILGLGFVFGRDSYIKNPWNMLDFVIVMSGLLTVGASTAVALTGSGDPDEQDSSGGKFSLSGLRSFRVMRPLKSISAIKGLKVLMNALFSAIPMLTDAIFIIIMFALVCCIAGNLLMSGLLKNLCFNLQTGALDPRYILCGGIGECRKGYICGKSNENPNLGITNFDNVFYAFVVFYQGLTVSGWSDIMAMMEQAYTQFIFVYFFPLFFTGAFFLLNLLLAVINSKFTEAHNEHLTQELETLKNKNNVEHQNTIYLQSKQSIHEYMLAQKYAKKMIAFYKSRKEERKKQEMQELEKMQKNSNFFQRAIAYGDRLFGVNEQRVLPISVQKKSAGMFTAPLDVVKLKGKIDRFNKNKKLQQVDEINQEQSDSSAEFQINIIKFIKKSRDLVIQDQIDQNVEDRFELDIPKKEQFKPQDKDRKIIQRLNTIQTLKQNSGAFNDQNDLKSDLKMIGNMGLKKIGGRNKDTYDLNSFVWPIKQKKLNDAFLHTLDFQNLIPDETQNFENQNQQNTTDQNLQVPPKSDGVTSQLGYESDQKHKTFSYNGDKEQLREKLKDNSIFNTSNDINSEFENSNEIYLENCKEIQLATQQKLAQYTPHYTKDSPEKQQKKNPQYKELNYKKKNVRSVFKKMLQIYSEKQTKIIPQGIDVKLVSNQLLENKFLSYQNNRKDLGNDFHQQEIERAKKIRGYVLPKKPANKQNIEDEIFKPKRVLNTKTHKLNISAGVNYSGSSQNDIFEERIFKQEKTLPTEANQYVKLNPEFRDSAQSDENEINYVQFPWNPYQMKILYQVYEDSSENELVLDNEDEDKLCQIAQPHESSTNINYNQLLKGTAIKELARRSDTLITSTMAISALQVDKREIQKIILTSMSKNDLEQFLDEKNAF